MKFNLPLKIFLSLALCFAIERFCYWKLDGFQEYKVLTYPPYDPKWDIPCQVLEIEELREILQQPFAYLARGRQNFSFVSQDGKYVVKLLHGRSYRRMAQINMNPFLSEQTKQKRVAAHRHTINWMYNSYKASIGELQEETAALYVHLNESDNIQAVIRVIDNIGIEHRFDADTVAFLVQEKAEPAYMRIDRLMERGEEEQAKRCVSQMMELLYQRSERGFHDIDPVIEKHGGFIGDKPILIDLGGFMRHAGPPANFRGELLNAYLPFLAWLEKRYPILAAHCQQQIEKFLRPEEKNRKDTKDLNDLNDVTTLREG